MLKALLKELLSYGERGNPAFRGLLTDYREGLKKKGFRCDRKQGTNEEELQQRTCLMEYQVCELQPQLLEISIYLCHSQARK